MEKVKKQEKPAKSSDLDADLEAQKAILTKLESECQKNFLDDKSLNETLGQYKMAAQDLKNSINEFLVSRNVSPGTDQSTELPGLDDRPLDEELKEKIDLLESTLKISGELSNCSNSSGNNANQATRVDNAATTDDQQQQQKQQSPPIANNNQQQQQPQPQSQEPQTPQQPQQIQQPHVDKANKGKKEANKKQSKTESDSKMEQSRTEAKQEDEAKVKVDSNLNQVNQSVAARARDPRPNLVELIQLITGETEISPRTLSAEASAGSPEKKLTKTGSTKRSAHKEKSAMDHILKNLNSENNEESQLKLLCKMYIELMEENRALEKGCKQHEKTCIKLKKEKEQLQTESNRLILAKSRLESLCRELQKHNKAIKEESLLRIKEEEEKHRSIAAKFQATLGEIMVLVQESQQRNNALREENLQYEKKLKIYLDHYDKWEKEIEKILASKDLEIQLIKTKLAEANLTSDHEREKLIEEKQQILNMVSDLHKKNSESVTNENHLKAQLSLYIAKYDEFQNILAKSNEMFTGFKKDMEKMSKQIKELEKETIRWKKKWEESNKALAVANEERKTSSQKIQKLENLCRALQAERNQLSEKLKQKETTESLAEKSVNKQQSNEEKQPEEPKENQENSIENLPNLPNSSCDEVETKA